MATIIESAKDLVSKATSSTQDDSTQTSSTGPVDEVKSRSETQGSTGAQQAAQPQEVEASKTQQASTDEAQAIVDEQKADGAVLAS